MEEEKKVEEDGKFVFVKNWIGKIILMIIGVIWLVSDLYDNIMHNFFLTDRDVENWGTMGDVLVLTATTALILGGWYLNTIFEVLKGKLSGGKPMR